MEKLHAQMWQFKKTANISETAAHRVKISWILTPGGKKRVCATSGTLRRISSKVQHELSELGKKTAHR